ncbi:MAG: hypothetical protein MK036_01195 [Dehalococcoidia bacterium]|nr:hypothetical protein [Dehalococcoidia bacterium]
MVWLLHDRLYAKTLNAQVLFDAGLLGWRYAVFALKGNLMDWDQIAIVAQIASGFATLAVAIFLASQLRLQHQDAQRELTFASENRQENLLLATVADASLAEAMVRGNEDFVGLSPSDKFRVDVIYQQMFLMSGSLWRLGRDGASTDRVKIQFGLLFDRRGMRQYYELRGRTFLYDDALRAIGDSVFQKFAGREVDLSLSEI